MSAIAEESYSDLWFDGIADAERAALSQRLLGQVSMLVKLAPFPDSAQRLLKAASDPQFRVADVRAIIERDPPLATRVLQVVNSAGYFTAAKCRSISHAITLLGSRALTQIAATMAILNMFADLDGIGAAVRNHCTTVASFAQTISRRLGRQSPEVLTCGLLHDLGKLLLAQFQKSYIQQVGSALRQPDASHIREREVLGYDHAVLAGHMLRRWNIPEPIPVVVAWHHQPQRAIASGGDIATQVCLIGVANRLAHAFAAGLTPDSPDWITLDGDAASDQLGLSEQWLRDAWPEMLSSYEEDQRLFGG